jgi:hypothetical protein
VQGQKNQKNGLIVKAPLLAVNYEARPFYIVIAAHGDAARLDKTLRSLATCRLPPGYRALLLVENGPRVGVEAIASAAPTDLRIRYLYHPPPSKSLALNQALALIDEPDAFIYFTDDDAGFAVDLLETYSMAVAAHGPGHYFGGPVDARWETAPPTWLIPSLPGSAKGWRPQPAAKLYAFPGINWGAFLVDLKVVGTFDPRFGPGSPHGATGQETDMQSRMFRTGMKAIYLEQAAVTHEVPRSRCNFIWTIHRHFRSGVSAGLAAIPFRPPSMLDETVAQDSFFKLRRLIARTGGAADLACRLTCELALRLGKCHGRWISRKYKN